MNYVKLIFKNINTEQKEILTALLNDFSHLGIEETEQELLIYFNENDQAEIEDMERILPTHFTYSTEIIPHENWNATWESNFEPLIVNNEVGLRAHFHAPFTNVKYDIEITPKMSFGTGHHETTQLMIEYLCNIDCEQKTVFDFGCGTGVLAILAKLKGAKMVLGIDNDAWSVENAIENCAKNNCQDIDIKIDAIETIHDKFDIIVANINLNILLFYMKKLKTLLAPNGHLFVSGILIEDIKTIENAALQENLKFNSSTQKNKWAAMHFQF